MPSTVAAEDHPSVHPFQSPSVRKHKSSTATGEVTSRQSLKIAHQRVNLDIDLANQIVHGETEITVLPLEQSLKQVKLDCRNIQITEVFVNNKRTTFHYNDFHWNDEFLNNPDNYYVDDLTPSRTWKNQSRFNPLYDINSKTFDVHQHLFYKGKYHPIYGNTNHLDKLNVNTDAQLMQLSYNHPYTPLLLTNTEELTINFPPGLRLKLQNPNSLSANPFSPAKSAHNTPFSAATNTTLLGLEQVYTPVQLRIKYIVRNPKNGIIFNGGLQTKIPRDQWFCYTMNNDVNFSTSCWVPCIDNYYEKCTWDVSISVPKTVGDIGDSKIIGTRAAEMAMRKQQRAEDDDEDEDEDEDEGGEDLKREIIVAAPELLNYSEVPHMTDFSKKMYNFQMYNPVVAQHVGFAVGPFEKLPLVGINEDIKDPDADPANAAASRTSTNVPLTIYYLPGQRESVINTCIFLYKAMNFYSKEFGSFPFNSYSIAFVNDLATKSCGFAGLSIVSDQFLYSADKVEPRFSSTEFLAGVLAEQWAGINVVPKTHNDIWCVVGIAAFMTAMFSKKLFGLNEFKYRNKLKSDLVCEQDIRKPPLAHQFFRFPINAESDLNFLKLKASLVLIILDRRMTKTDKSFGLSRVIPKIFLQAMSNDLFNGNCLSTYHFKHVCEKVNHNRLDNFFKNWVYSSGTPVFRITQKFNKKRMVIELTVRQVQIQELNSRNENGMLNSGLSSESRHSDENFINDSLNFIENEDSEHNVPAIFQGPMTIRVHEADGTPYEHIVELKDGVSKLDIPYNTKYRRLKRGKKRQVEYYEENEAASGQNGVQIEEVKVNCLGDVLQSPAEVNAWNLQDWSRDDEEQNQDSFEWIRVDADFEWICKVHLHQPDYMFFSQLQQDRDVEAQIESVRFFGNAVKPTSLYSSILTRTVMDERYFYGVRIEALIGLAKLAKEEISFIGMRHLLKCYQSLYCYPTPYNILTPISEKNYLSLANDFENAGRYFILKMIPKALASIKLPDGETPLEIRKIILNMLKFNDNLNNKYDDSYYLATVIESIFESICNSGGFLKDFSDNPEAANFMNEVDIEMSRILKLDQFLPSFNSAITREIVKQKVKAARLGLYRITYEELLAYTKPGLNDDLRITAFHGLLVLGGLKNSEILHYFFTVAKIDESAKVRLRLIDVFLDAITVAAIHGTPSILDDQEFDDFYANLDGEASAASRAADSNESKGTGMVFIEDRANKLSIKSRRDAFARASITGAIDILRRDYAIGKGLQKEIWSALHSNLLSIRSKRSLFDVCDLLYEPRDSFIVTINRLNGKKISAKVGKFRISDVDPNSKVLEVTLRREGRLKIQLPKLIDKKKDKKIKLKTENTLGGVLPKIKLSASSVSIPAVEPVKLVKIESKLLVSLGSQVVKLKFTTDAGKEKLKALSTKNSSSVNGKSKASTPVPVAKPPPSIAPEIKKPLVEIKRSTPSLPLRYVRITSKGNYKLMLSSDPIDTIETPLLTIDNNLSGEIPSIKVKFNFKKLNKSENSVRVKEEEPVKISSLPENGATNSAPPLLEQRRESPALKMESTLSSIKLNSIPALSNNGPHLLAQPTPKIKLKFNFNKSK